MFLGLILGVGYCFDFNFIEYFESTFRVNLVWKMEKCKDRKWGDDEKVGG